jgi:uncharacterized protein
METSMRSLFASLALLLLAAAPAAAQSLEELRKSGAVGERFDGLAVVREAGAGTSIETAVREINDKRRMIYAERAKAQSVPATEVGKVYALEIMQKAPAGTWFLDETGKWVQKK